MTLSFRKLSVLLASLVCMVVANSAYAQNHPMRALKDAVFEQRGPAMSIAPVWGNPKKGPFAAFVKIKAGHIVPLHTHTNSYHGVVIQGNWIHVYGKDIKNRHVMKPGDYALQPGKDVHTDGCAGPKDCIFLVTFLGSPDIIPFKKK